MMKKPPMRYYYKINNFILAFILLAGGCSNGAEESEPALQPLLAKHIEVPEPSGLSISPDEQFLWTVSDFNGQVYKLDLRGQVLKILPAPYPDADLEGIASDPDPGFLWLVEERNREVLKIDTTGTLLSRTVLDINTAPNSGPEGITWNSQAQRLYVLTEKRPSLLLQLNADLMIEQQYTLSGARDYSGLFYDAALDRFWIVSDQSRLLFRWNIASGMEKSYDLGFDKAEGVVISGNKAYIVSDSTEMLYIFELTD